MELKIKFDVVGTVKQVIELNAHGESLGVEKIIQMLNSGEVSTTISRTMSGDDLILLDKNFTVLGTITDQQSDGSYTEFEEDISEFE